LSEVVPVPSIRQVFANSALISGTGKRGNSIIVTFANGNTTIARVNEFDSWTVSVPQSVSLVVDDYVYLVQVDKHGVRSKGIITVIRPETKMPVLDDIVYVIYQNDLPISNEVYTDFFRAQTEVQNTYGVSPVSPNRLVQVDFAREVIIRSVFVTWENGDAVIIIPGYTIVPAIRLSIVPPEIFQPPSKAVEIVKTSAVEFYSVQSVLWENKQDAIWNPNTDSFQPKCSYSVSIELQAEDGYTFYGVRPMYVTLNLMSPVIVRNSGDSLTLRYDFPALPVCEVSNFNILVDYPSALNHPVPVIENSDHAKILNHHWQFNDDNPYGTFFGARISFELSCLIEPNPHIDWEQHNKPGIFTVNGDATFAFYLITEDGVWVHYKFIQPE